MRIMFLFCMARVAVAIAGLAVMAYVALGCTWAAIEETAPIAESDDGACLRVDYPLIEPGACSIVGIEEVAKRKVTPESGQNPQHVWANTGITIPAAEWWLIKPKGAGYTAISTADLHDVGVETLATVASIENAIYIASAPEIQVALSRDGDDNLLLHEETEHGDIAIYRFVTE